MSTVVDPKVKEGRDDEITHIPDEEKNEQKLEYPGVPTTCDGAAAVVHVETAVCHGSGAYPITSSTTMGSGFNNAVHNGGAEPLGRFSRVHGAGKRALVGFVL